MRPHGANAYFLGLAVAILAPLAIPGVGLDFPYLYVFLILLFCWSLFRWDRVKALPSRGSKPEWLSDRRLAVDSIVIAAGITILANLLLPLTT